MLCTIQGKCVDCFFKVFDFEATDKREAKHVECYRLVIRDEHAYSERDQYFTVTVPLDTAKKWGMDKPQWLKDNIGKDLKLEGALTTSFDKLTFQLAK